MGCPSPPLRRCACAPGGVGLSLQKASVPRTLTCCPRPRRNKAELLQDAGAQAREGTLLGTGHVGARPPSP